MTIPEELRTAARTLRSDNFIGVRYSNDDVSALLHAREPLAELLETEADTAEDILRDTPALTGEQLAAIVHGPLAIARAINGGQQ
ncbi:hypothetical protein [Streptomyces albicerus]|uniref:hypothetical protein n=1 Tax=Streptomyces albicerus TaxID=2569859 RepID=UPI00124BA31A|nr:hypothetical protein [Streptomyces albicerus]